MGTRNIARLNDLILKINIFNRFVSSENFFYVTFTLCLQRI